MADTSNFFDALRDHTEIKLRIFGKYVVPWAAKLGYKARYRGTQNLWYVDGFAGEGKSKSDGADGSPLIAARHAARLIEQGQSYSLGCVNVEIKRRRHASLERNTDAFKNLGVSIHNLPGDFSDRIGDIVRIIGQNDPALVFIDPFGLSPLRFSKIKPLLKRPGEIDLFVTFMTGAVSRLATDHPEIITQAIGSSDWSDPISALKTFRRNLKRESRFLGVASYAIRQTKKAAPRYHLIFGSRSYDAFELMNDFVAQEEETLDRGSYAALAQQSFLMIIDEQEEERDLLEAITEFGRQHPSGTTRSDIVRHLVITRWGQWHTKEVRKAIWGLMDAGLLVRHKSGRGNIDTDKLTFA